MAKDANNSLRFVNPSDPPPFVARTFRLKQCDVEGLDGTGIQAMSLFSSFRDMWEENRRHDIEDAKATLAMLSPSVGSKYEVRTDELPNRRFSGDGFLSPTRYFTLCQEGDRDGGTMQREMTAYHDPLMTGAVDIIDLSEAGISSKHFFNDGSSNVAEMPQSVLLLLIPPYTAVEHTWLEHAARQWETTEVRIPARVSEERFKRVIDLRVPHVAAWFTHNLTRLQWVNNDGIEGRAFPQKVPLDQFTALLPSLMVQSLGGGDGATRIAGQWLRAMGADALVFPSARSDSSVKILDGKIVSFYGWNLVDYRGARPPRLQTYDLTRHWVDQMSQEIDKQPLSVYADVVLHSEVNGPGKDSWSWANIEEANHAMRLLATADHLYLWARGGVSPEQRRQLHLMLGGTDRAETLALTSAAFIGGLLGDTKLRRMLIEAASQGMTSGQAEFLDFPGTFAQIDDKFAAIRSGRLA